MRKIEQLMNKAIRTAYDETIKVGSNTLVVADKRGGVDVYLHGNHIASGYKGDFVANAATFYNWPTRTTVSRLRALGIDARVKGGAAILDGSAI